MEIPPTRPAHRRPSLAYGTPVGFRNLGVVTSGTQRLPGAVGRALRVATAVALVASTLLWVRGPSVGAWSSTDGAVAAFGSSFQGGLAVDGSGNIYTSGYFQSTVDVDPGPGTLNFTSA